MHDASYPPGTGLKAMLIWRLGLISMDLCWVDQACCLPTWYENTLHCIQNNKDTNNVRSDRQTQDEAIRSQIKKRRPISCRCYELERPDEGIFRLTIWCELPICGLWLYFGYRMCLWTSERLFGLFAQSLTWQTPASLDTIGEAPWL